MLKYQTGNAADPRAFTHNGVIIAHVVNDCGGWGRGFVLSLSERWKEPERTYRRNWRTLRLGDVQFVTVETGVIVANMCAQHGYVSATNPVALDYDALWNCLNSVRYKALKEQASVQMPRIGAGLAGGDWETIESIILRRLDEAGIEVTVVDLPKSKQLRRVSTTDQQ